MPSKEFLPSPSQTITFENSSAHACPSSFCAQESHSASASSFEFQLSSHQRVSPNALVSAAGTYPHTPNNDSAVINFCQAAIIFVAFSALKSGPALQAMNSA